MISEAVGQIKIGEKLKFMEIIMNNMQVRNILLIRKIPRAR